MSQEVIPPLDFFCYILYNICMILPEMKILKDDEVITQADYLYSWFAEWAKQLNTGFTINQIWQLYIDGKIKSDNSILFYNFVKVFKYFEVNKLYGVGK